MSRWGQLIPVFPFSGVTRLTETVRGYMAWGLAVESPWF
jgi:hypothetical protein